MLSKVQIGHIARFISQKINIPTVAIIGGYHGGNLGDMALGYAVKDRLKEKGYKSGLQTIYNLEKWPVAKYAIIGGGAVGYIDSLTRVYNRYKGKFSHVAFLGVDFNNDSYPDFLVEMFKAVPFLSCRSEEQALKMKTITGRHDIKFHPDIAYSLKKDYCRSIRDKRITNHKKLLLVNTLPLYGTMKAGKLEPLENYKEERPEVYENFSNMHTNYEKILRNEIERAISEGYAINYISFTPVDEQYGRLILKGLPVRYHPYQDDPFKMIQYMSIGSQAITTRYHATIFAIKLGLELKPIAYARKNEFMLQSLGLMPEDFIPAALLASAQSPNEFQKSIVISSTLIDKWETEAIDLIDSCIDAILK